MQPIRLTAVLAFALAVAGCTGGGGPVASSGGSYHPSGTGPFDRSGNYVEAWADNPSKWRGRSVPPPPTGAPAVPKPQPQLAATKPAPPPIAAVTPAAAATPTPPPITPAGTQPVSQLPPPPKPQPAATAQASSKPPAPKPKPKPTSTKPKKPAPLRVTVAKGDTLSAIAKRNKTTVTAIKQANGLKSDLIRPGQRLVVPRYR